MVKKPVTALLVAILALPLGARAQQRPVPQGSAGGEVVAPSPAQNPEREDSVDPAKLGVSLDRIRRELSEAEVREHSGERPLRLEFTVKVFGFAPKIDLLENYPLTGPAPYGAPTHREVLDVLTPQEFRSPPIPLSAIASWAAQQLWNRSEKQRCEEELAEYKRLVMQGVAVAAPRCAR